MRTLKFITGHVIFKLLYNQIYQLKTTQVSYAEDPEKFLTIKNGTLTIQKPKHS